METDYTHDPDGRLAAMPGNELDAELAKQRRLRDMALRKEDRVAAAEAFEQILCCLVEQIRRGLSSPRNMRPPLH